MHDETYTSLFSSSLADAYDFYLHPRPSKKDGLGVLLKKGKFRVHAVRGATLSRWGSRVGLLMDLEATGGPGEGQEAAAGEGQRVVLLSTHLSFPHNRFDENQQHRQVLSLTRMLEAYVKGREAAGGRQRMLQVLCGDFNVDLAHPVLDPIHALGFRHVLGAGEGKAGGRKATETASQQLVTHRTHRGEDVAVDHIFFRPYDSAVVRRRAPVEGGKASAPLAAAASSFSSSFLESLWSGRRGVGGEVGGGAGQEKKEGDVGQAASAPAPPPPPPPAGVIGGAGQRRWTDFVPASSWGRERGRARATPPSSSFSSSSSSCPPSSSSVVWGREGGCVDALLPSVEVVDVALCPPSLCTREWPSEFGEKISDHRPLRAALNVTRMV